MNWHHRASLRRTHSLSGGDIQAKCSFIDIRKNRSCPHIAHRFGRGEKAVGGDDDIVTRLDSRGFQGKFQCRCSIAYADHVLAAKICANSRSNLSTQGPPTNWADCSTSWIASCTSAPMEAN